MNVFVKELIAATAVCAIAVSLSPTGKSGTARVMRTISALLIALTVLSPLSTISRNIGSLFEIKTAPEEEYDRVPQFDGSVIERTAANISDYVIRTMADKFGIKYGVRVSVIIDDRERSSVRLTEIQVFTKVRIDSYRDREIEDWLSTNLGCRVFIFSE